MENKKELFTQFQENKDLFDEEPKDNLWYILEERMDHRKKVKKLQWYKYVSVAAIGIILVSVVSFLNHYLTNHVPDRFVSNESFSSFILEDLQNDGNKFFNTSSLYTINKAYHKTPTSKNLVNIVGNYQSPDGIINFNILFENYQYMLIFDLESSPNFILESTNGTALEFKSIEGKSLELNLDEKGLQLTNSNFLSEYKNSFFKKISEI